MTPEQAVAAATDTAAATCPVRRTIGGTPFRCVQPPHDAGNLHQDAYRRRQGKVPRSDRHYFVAAS